MARAYSLDLRERVVILARGRADLLGTGHGGRSERGAERHDQHTGELGLELSGDSQGTWSPSSRTRPIVGRVGETSVSAL